MTALEHSWVLPTIDWPSVMDTSPYGIVLVSAQGAAEAGNPSVLYLNQTLLSWVDTQTVSRWQNQSETLRFSDCIQLSKQSKGKLHLAVDMTLDGYLMGQRGEGDSTEPLRVKIQATPILEDQMLYWLEPYSETQAMSKAHSDFVSVVSHEFRTPLTSIKGFADTMLRYGAKLPPEQQTRFITIIKDQADRLTRMVENLLAASKMGSGKVEIAYRANDLKKMVDKVSENILAKGSQDNTYANRAVQIQVASQLPEVWADQDKLEQVLTNLIDNAVKYSFPESVVVVKAWLDDEAVETDGNRVKVSVANRGVGIPPEYISQIFTQFSRIDNPLTRQVEGTGLGLYITKSMVTAMGGVIKVESVPNEETVFTVTLKAATAELQEKYHQALLEKDSQNTDLEGDVDGETTP